MDWYYYDFLKSMRKDSIDLFFDGFKTSSESVAIISPHDDDALLGAGYLIQALVEQSATLARLSELLPRRGLVRYMFCDSEYFLRRDKRLFGSGGDFRCGSLVDIANIEAHVRFPTESERSCSTQFHKYTS